MTINTIFHFSVCLSLVVFCSGFVIPTIKKGADTALFYGPDNQDEDFKNQNSDEFLWNNLNRNLPGDSTTNDWRQFRAKLVAQEQNEGASSNTQIDPFDPLNNAHDEGSINVSPETPQLTAHRWAHPIDHLETGCVLIASENLGGIFYGKVLLVVDHSSEGTTAIVVNSIFPGGLAEVSTNQGSVLDNQLLNAFPTTDVAYGGNVHTSEYSLLHGFGEVDGSKKITSGVYFGGEDALVHEVMNGRFDPNKGVFVKGKANWFPGRLQAEIDSGKWYIASASSNFILRNAGALLTEGDDSNDLWKDILTCMGGIYANIACQYAGNLKP